MSSCSEKSSQAKIKFVFLVKQLVSVGQWRLLSLDCARASVHSSPAAGDSSRRKHLSALIIPVLPITDTNDCHQHQQAGLFYYSEIQVALMIFIGWWDGSIIIICFQISEPHLTQTQTFRSKLQPNKMVWGETEPYLVGQSWDVALTLSRRVELMQRPSLLTLTWTKH